MNKVTNVKIETSLISLIKSYETSLRKEPEQIIVNAETSGISYYIKYLKNITKIVKVVN